jgi:hypothetical protein
MNALDLSALAGMLEQAEAADAARRPGPKASPGSAVATAPTVVRKPASAAAAAAAAAAATAAAGAAGAAAGGGAGVGSRSKDIWDAAELPASAADAEEDAAADGRARPRFEVLFKQRVGAEETFLGIGGVTPSSVHCEALLVRVELPGAAFKDIDLDVRDDGRFCVSTGAFRLRTFLPMRVREKEGSAKWDAAKATLSVTLPIVQSALWGTSTSE